MAQNPPAPAQARNNGVLNVPNVGAIGVGPVPPGQAEFVQARVLCLNANNPMVEFELEAPLHRTLFDELKQKGYCVSYFNEIRTVDRDTIEYHHVTVSLPKVHNGYVRRWVPNNQHGLIRTVFGWIY